MTGFQRSFRRQKERPNRINIGGEKPEKLRNLRGDGLPGGRLGNHWPGDGSRGDRELEGMSWDVLTAGETKGKGVENEKCEKCKVKIFLMAKTDPGRVRLE